MRRFEFLVLGFRGAQPAMRPLLSLSRKHICKKMCFKRALKEVGEQPLALPQSGGQCVGASWDHARRGSAPFMLSRRIYTTWERTTVRSLTMQSYNRQNSLTMQSYNRQNSLTMDKRWKVCSSSPHVNTPCRNTLAQHALLEGWADPGAQKSSGMQCRAPPAGTPQILSTAEGENHFAYSSYEHKNLHQKILCLPRSGFVFSSRFIYS